MNVLVTGASKGIGKQIALDLAGEHKVFITARSQKQLESIGLEYFICDLTNPKELEALGNFIQEKKIDVLINNAGGYIYENAQNMTYEQINNLTLTNLTAPIYLCAKAIAYMKQNNFGRIINIGSISGVMGEANASIYSATKAGLIGLTKSLALELAGDGITVNCINPGWVETELGLKSIEESEFTLQETLETIPQKRFVCPQEISDLVKYLITAKGLTGQSINICAGLSLGI